MQTKRELLSDVALRPIMALVMILAVILSAAPAFADTITGTIRNDGPDQPLKITVDGQTASLAIQTKPILAAYLQHLRTGDSITVQGTIDAQAQVLRLDSIDRVGLQELLGAWKSSRWEIFEFRDFNQLNLYVPTFWGGNVSLEKTHSLKYIITPEQANRFSIFISDTNEVRMGFIEVGKNQLTLSVTDFKTGHVVENISLSPLFTP